LVMSSTTSKETTTSTKTRLNQRLTSKSVLTYSIKSKLNHESHTKEQLDKESDAIEALLKDLEADNGEAHRKMETNTMFSTKDKEAKERRQQMDLLEKELNELNDKILKLEKEKDNKRRRNDDKNLLNKLEASNNALHTEKSELETQVNIVRKRIEDFER
jgi:hypothetical protein